ncbi:putative lipoprotein [Corallococcus coralloides]|uniref:Putative lipoprotein n=1 Tax=Corallococcus coralloides TaxID=184914 RepID=A0A410RTE1_CORCK|nr:putative metal-binding motif-containing protein [Corallococcus coralloides]QAT85180.1 putative lipoprotein [Corallococcus coralloides]
MRLFCLLTCMVLLSACRMKDPAEGVLRVTVKYVSQEPRCVRVEVGDGVHLEKADVPSSEFQDKEFQLAMVRKPDWNRLMNLTVTSFSAVSGTQCAGTVVEVRHNPSLDVAPGTSADWSVTLRATDADGDGYFAEAPGSERPDCDDSNANAYPGATESCGSRVDLDCNQLVGCQEPNCAGQSCDDGNACTLGDHCEGSGLEARCLPSQTTTCSQPTGVCDARQACNPTSGICEAVESTVGKTCDDGNPCTDTDECGADGKCVGTARTCTTAEQCLASSGTCNPTNGQCVFTPLPAVTSCQDPLACTTPDRCDGNGNCVGTPATCTPAPCYRVKQLCTVNTECEYEVDLNGTCTTSGGVPGVCSDTAECSPFPYRPSNFDPNSIAAADIGELSTSGNVTFDTTSRSWSPLGQVTTRDTIKYVLLDQGAGNPQAVLIPVTALTLNGTLTVTGPNPVIFAVYGSATVAQSILATGTIDNPNAACGTSQGGAGTSVGSTGGGGGGGGNGTTGADGGNAYNAQNRGAAGINRATGPEPLLGGCPGGNGGAGSSSGRGGAGGGAIQLSVAHTLTLDKTLSTSGNGGAGGSTGGGGGGGSGGQVVVEAFQLNLTAAARITANGGGGGEGGTTTGNAGGAGANGSQASGTPANGGTGNNSIGGAGGAGGAGTAPPVKGTDGTRDGFGTEGSGGGGGGSVGSIHLRSVQSCVINASSVISPAPTGGCAPP